MISTDFVGGKEDRWPGSVYESNMKAQDSGCLTIFFANMKTDTGQLEDNTMRWPGSVCNKAILRHRTVDI